MGFPVRNASRHGRPDARRFAWIDDIHIEADVHAVGPLRDALDRITRDGVHATPVDVGHRVDMHAGRTQEHPLARVEVTRADDGDALWLDVRAFPGGVHQARIALARQSRQDHAMHIATGGGFGRVEVAVGIKPDDANRAARPRRATDRAQRDAVIAPQNYWEAAVGEALGHSVRQRGIHRHDGIEEFQPRISDRGRFRVWYWNGSQVFDLMAQGK